MDGTPVIGDFGICHVEDGEPVTLSDEAVGSRHYVAPEMEAGNRALSVSLAIQSTCTAWARCSSGWSLEAERSIEKATEEHGSLGC